MFYQSIHNVTGFRIACVYLSNGNSVQVAITNQNFDGRAQTDLTLYFATVEEAVRFALPHADERTIDQDGEFAPYLAAYEASGRAAIWGDPNGAQRAAS